MIATRFALLAALALAASPALAESSGAGKPTHALTVFSHDGTFGVVAPGYAGQMLFTVYNMSQKAGVSGLQFALESPRKAELSLKSDCPAALGPMRKCQVAVEWAPGSEGFLDGKLLARAGSPKIEISSSLDGQAR